MSSQRQQDERNVIINDVAKLQCKQEQLALPLPEPSPAIAPEPDPDGWVAPRRMWDDGEEVIDEDWSITVHCGRCGCRPRPQHHFRCRLHDDMLANAYARPSAPFPVAPSKIGGCNGQDPVLERYQRQMAQWRLAWAEWSPEWLPEQPYVDEGPGEEDWDRDDEDDYYALPCVRCNMATQRRGRAGTAMIEAKLLPLKQATRWLIETEYAEELLMGCTADGDAVIRTTVGAYGRCYNCMLQVGIAPGSLDALREQNESC